MATDPWTWIERHEAERLGGCSTNDFPRIDVQCIAEPRHFVGHAYVDGAKSIFQELGGLGHARRADRVDISHNLRIEVSGGFRGLFGYAANDFGNVVSLKLRVPGIHAFRRKSEQ